MGWEYRDTGFSTHSLGVQARGYWGYGRGNTGNTGVTGVMGVNASVHTAWEYRPGVTGVMDVGIQVIQGLLGLWA